MSRWGADLYGDPCRECGFEWSISPGQAVNLIAGTPDEYALLLAGATGLERHPDLEWTVVGYVCHVADNLRIWAERLAGATLAGRSEVVGYDTDLLAVARRYDSVSLSGALWSLRNAVQDWERAIRLAADQDAVLIHDSRGRQRWSDVALNNAHDAAHHAWDIRRSLGA